MEMQKKDFKGGLILITIGLLALAFQFLPIQIGENMGLLIVPGLGALFLVWGILTHTDGLMIPGGILSGVGWGIYAIAGPFSIWQGDSEGGVFLIFLGLGFGLITLVTAVFGKRTHGWALIPGGIITFVGVAVLFGGALLSVLAFAGKLWPLALILIGISVLVKGNKEKVNEEKYVPEK